MPIAEEVKHIVADDEFDQVTEQDWLARLVSEQERVARLERELDERDRLLSAALNRGERLEREMSQQREDYRAQCATLAARLREAVDDRTELEVRLRLAKNAAVSAAQTAQAALDRLVLAAEVVESAARVEEAFREDDLYSWHRRPVERLRAALTSHQAAVARRAST